MTATKKLITGANITGRNFVLLTKFRAFSQHLHRVRCEITGPQHVITDKYGHTSMTGSTTFMPATKNFCAMRWNTLSGLSTVEIFLWLSRLPWNDRAKKNLLCVEVHAILADEHKVSDKLVQFKEFIIVLLDLFSHRLLTLIKLDELRRNTCEWHSHFLTSCGSPLVL